MILAELAGGVTEIEQELGERRRAGRTVDGLPGSCGGIMPCAADAWPLRRRCASRAALLA